MQNIDRSLTLSLTQIENDKIHARPWRKQACFTLESAMEKRRNIHSHANLRSTFVNVNKCEEDNGDSPCMRHQIGTEIERKRLRIATFRNFLVNRLKSLDRLRVFRFRTKMRVNRRCLSVFPSKTRRLLSYRHVAT